MTDIQAVLTGDLIGSRGASTAVVEGCMQLLKKTATSLGKIFETDLRFTRHRGDGWQILLERPHTLYETYLALVAQLCAYDAGLATKVSIGLGTVTSRGTNDLSDASGDAFLASGDLLEHLSASSGPQRVFIGGDGSASWQMGILRMTDWIAQNWSAQQAEAVALYLMRDDLNTNAERAAVLGISRQAYEARFRSSGFPALVDAREAFLDYNYGNER